MSENPSLFDVEKSNSIRFNDEHRLELEVIKSIKGNVGWRSNRRSVKLHLNGWCGYKKLKELFSHYPGDDYRVRTLFLLFWVSGGRASEVISLKPNQFSWNDEAIKIEKMPVLKTKDKTFRNVLCPLKDDPLAPLLIPYLEKYDIDDPSKIFPYTRKHAYKLITAFNPNIWLHWIRGQRAFNLHVVYGFNVFQLKDWFNWKRVDTPLWYIQQSLTEFAKDFGIKNVPSRE